MWNAKMKEYLGITPENDAEGMLQDVHWSVGLMGYFPTYALGNLVSAQLWECMNKDIPTLEEQVEKAQFSEILGWLRKNLHVYGAKFEPQTLVKKVTGSFITPEPYVKYLESKFKSIYSL
jgi:carboxypeptidase Taq